MHIELEMLLNKVSFSLRIFSLFELDKICKKYKEKFWKMGKVPKVKEKRFVSQKYLTMVEPCAIISNCADVFCEFCHAIQEEFP